MKKVLVIEDDKSIADLAGNSSKRSEVRSNYNNGWQRRIENSQQQIHSI